MRSNLLSCLRFIADNEPDPYEMLAFLIELFVFFIKLVCIPSYSGILNSSTFKLDVSSTSLFSNFSMKSMVFCSEPSLEFLVLLLKPLLGFLVSDGLLLSFASLRSVARTSWPVSPRL